MPAKGVLQIRDELLDTSRVFGKSASEMSTGRKGALIGHMNEAFGSDENRRIALEWLFGKSSSGDLTRGEWYAVSQWIGSWHDESGWHVRPDFYVESSTVIKYALRLYAARMLGVDPNGVVAHAAALPGLKVIRQSDQYQDQHKSDG